MFKTQQVYKYFLIAVLFSTVMQYFLKNSLIAYGPIVPLMALVIVVEILCLNKMKLRDWGAIFIWLPYVLIASYTFIKNPLDGVYFSAPLLLIIALPVIILSFLRLQYYSKDFNYAEFMYKTLFCFLFLQLIVCLGQMSTYFFGFGFHVTKNFESGFMVSGTLFNANSLGALLILISYVFITIEKKFTNKKVISMWLLIAILLLITSSRASLFMAFLIFIFSRELSFKTILIYTVIFSLLIFVYNILLSAIDYGVFYRIVGRIESLRKIITNGAGYDGSIEFRLVTYRHFMENITNLGFGSGELYDYSIFAKNAGSHSSLLFQNPHSLLVEVGYWLGWPGLLSFLLGSGYLFVYSKTKLLLAITLLVSFTVPASVLANIVYFYFYIAAILSRKENAVQTNEKA